MSENLLFGLLSTLVPGFVVGYLMLGKNAGVFRMFVAMLLVGIGYLTATGAIEDIGGRILGRGGEATAVPAAAPASAPAAEKAAPAPAAEAPKADAAPAAEKPAEAPKP